MIGFEMTKSHAAKYVKRYRLQIIVVVMLVILAGVMMTFFSTKDKTPQVTSGHVIIENDGYHGEKSNPLLKGQQQDVEDVVRTYYQRVEEGSDYVERYDDLEVYVKQGRYEDTFVVFAVYQMKIPDIYTKVPGLETLYVYKNEMDELRVTTEIHTQEISALVETLAAHNDVQAIMTSIQEEYQAAVEADAMLQEMLTDLQQASNEKE